MTEYVSGTDIDLPHGKVRQSGRLTVANKPPEIADRTRTQYH
jgi:hypothetical protein